MAQLRCTLVTLFLLALARTVVAAQAEPAAPAPPPTAVATPAPAPTAAPPPAEPTYYESIQVRTAEVEVVVTDRSGQRVMGLARDDFALFEDGAAVEITGFSAPATAAAPAMPASEPAPPSGAPAAPRTAAEPGDDRLLVALFIDRYGLGPGARKRLLPALREMLAERMRPGDQLLVASREGGGSATILLPPTEDVAAVLATVEEASKGVGGANSPLAQVSRILHQIERMALPPTGPGASAADQAFGRADAERTYDEIRTFSEQATQHAIGTVAALSQVVEGLAGLPGRKAVLLLGGAVSLRPARAVYDAWRNRLGGQADSLALGSRIDDVAEDPTLLRALTSVSELANGNRVTLYAWGTTDVPGTGDASLATATVWGPTEQATASFDLRQSLQRLVEPTGGSASTEAGDPGRFLRELRADLDSHYVLAYTPRTGGAGARQLRVEVRQPGLSVRHREARNERTREQSMIERTRAALLFGWQDNPLGVAIELGPATAPDKKGVAQLPVTVSMPMSRLVLIPQAEFHEGRLTMYVGAGDEAGGSSGITEIAIPVRVPNQQLLTALSQRAAYRTRLAVRAARQRIAVSVRDEIGNAAATLVVEHPSDEEAIAPAPTPRPGGR